MEQGFSVEKLAGRRVTVLGAGRSGLAAARCLARRGARVFLSDSRPLSQEAKRTLGALQIDFEEGAHTDAALEAELLVVSPGIPWEAKVLNAARQGHLPVWGELELGYRLCPSDHIVAVTGTNGKSTTTRLIATLLGARGHAVAVGGNLGTPLCALLEGILPHTWVVLEVSSFQLEAALTFRPHIGVWLNLTPDHLDRHGTLQRYTALKASLFANQRATDHAVLGPHVRLPPTCPSQRHTIQPLPVDLPEHQRFNLSAALCAAQLADPACRLDGVDWQTAFLQSHCLEFVTTVNGVRFFNDSKATNPQATIAALETLKPAPLSVILGGTPKGAPTQPLARYIASHPHVRQALLVGPFAPHWATALKNEGWHRFRSAGSLQEALNLLDPDLQTCVLAPAGASFDQFADYQARGDAFKAAVHALKEAAG